MDSAVHAALVTLIVTVVITWSLYMFPICLLSSVVKQYKIYQIDYLSIVCMYINTCRWCSSSDGVSSCVLSWLVTVHCLTCGWLSGYNPVPLLCGQKEFKTNIDCFFEILIDVKKINFLPVFCCLWKMVAMLIIIYFRIQCWLNLSIAHCLISITVVVNYFTVNL